MGQYYARKTFGTAVPLAWRQRTAPTRVYEGQNSSGLFYYLKGILHKEKRFYIWYHAQGRALMWVQAIGILHGRQLWPTLKPKFLFLTFAGLLWQSTVQQYIPLVLGLGLQFSLRLQSSHGRSPAIRQTTANHDHCSVLLTRALPPGEKVTQLLGEEASGVGVRRRWWAWGSVSFCMLVLLGFVCFRYPRCL